MSEPSAKELLQSVQSLYLEGDYQGAIDALTKNRELLDLGLFHFNLGTLYLKNEQWGPGRYHLEKALKVGLVSEAQYHNLSVAKAKPGLVGLDSSQSWSEYALNTALAFPRDAYISSSLLLLTIGLYFVRRSLAVSWIKIISGLIFAALPSAFYLFFLAELKEAVVLKDSPIREGPSQIYAEGTSLQAGSKIIVGKQSGNWYFIRYPRNHGGWIGRQDLGFL